MSAAKKTEMPIPTGKKGEGDALLRVRDLAGVVRMLIDKFNDNQIIIEKLEKEVEAIKQDVEAAKMHAETARKEAAE